MARQAGPCRSCRTLAPTMLRWSEFPPLIELEEFYSELRRSPTSFTDDEVIRRVGRTYWPTNCWSFVEASFAILSPAGLIKPSAVRGLIEEPIRAMIYGGLQRSADVVGEGLAVARKIDPIVELTAEAREWLVEHWPKYESTAVEIFDAVWNESSES